MLRTKRYTSKRLPAAINATVRLKHALGHLDAASRQLVDAGDARAGNGITAAALRVREWHQKILSSIRGSTQ